MQAADFVESYFDAWNHSDPQAVADHLAVDGVYRDIPENSQRSHNELVTSLRAFFARHRHRYELIGEILCGCNTIAFQYQMLPISSNSDRNTSHIYSGAEFITLHGDAAMTITDYYDAPVEEESRLHYDQSTAEISGRKYAKSGLSDSKLLQLKDKLERIMSGDLVYLQADLTLPTLAERVGCSVNHLSQVINSGFNVSFFEYLNQYRIKHATKLLLNGDGRDGAILNIAFTVGFNSNSAFYSAFRKHVGRTPAQYRREHAILRNDPIHN